jgi:hypothetical protein
MQEPEHRTIQTGRRYVLGEGEDFYGIWDREPLGKLVETFELTEAGLLEATRRFMKLSREDFWARFGPKALRWALFGGLAVWVLSGLVLWIRYAVATPGPISPILASPMDPFVGFGQPGWVKVAQVAENVAFRVWVGGVAILVALRLFERGRQAA